MSRIDSLLEDYASFHQTKGNKACHFVGVPLIIFGILSMLHSLQVSSLTAAEVFVLLSFFYYLTLHLPLAVGMLLIAAFIDLAAYAVGSILFGLATFIMGWIFQAIGHAVFEKKSPAFLKNITHLMVGPLFLLNELLHIRPITLRTQTS